MPAQFGPYSKPNRLYRPNPKGAPVARIGFPSARECVRRAQPQGWHGGRAYACRPPSETPRMGPYHARSVRPRSATPVRHHLPTQGTPADGPKSAAGFPHEMRAGLDSTAQLERILNYFAEGIVAIPYSALPPLHIYVACHP